MVEVALILLKLKMSCFSFCFFAFFSNFVKHVFSVLVSFYRLQLTAKVRY